MEPENMAAAPMQAQADVRLAGPRELLKGSWTTYKANWKGLATIVAMPAVLSLLGQILFLTDSLPVSLLAFILLIASIVLSIAMQGALMDASRKASEGPANLSWKEQYRFGFRYFWPFVLVAIIAALVFLGSSVLFVIPGFIVMIYASMYVAALVIDDKRGFSALTESFNLIRGRWWKTLGRILILSLVMIAVMLVYGLIVGIITASIGSAAANSAGYAVAMSILSTIMNVIITPFAVLYIYQFYKSLKETRLPEGAVGAFKKWLVAFLVIGIVAAVILVVSLPLIMMASIKQARMLGEQARMDYQAQMEEVQRAMQEGTGQMMEEDTGTGEI